METKPTLLETTYALFRVVNTLLTYVAHTQKSKEMLIQLPYDLILPADKRYSKIYLTLDLKATWDEKIDED